MASRGKEPGVMEREDQDAGAMATAGPAQDTASNLRMEEQTGEIIRILQSSTDHEILDIPVDASEERIRRQYRVLALIVHPDKTQHPHAGEAFNVLAQAFARLTRSSESGAIVAEVDAREIFRNNWGIDDLPEGMLTEELIQLELSKIIGDRWLDLGICLGMEPGYLRSLTGNEHYQQLPLLMMMAWSTTQVDPMQARHLLAASLQKLEKAALAERVLGTDVAYLQHMYVEVASEMSGTWKDLAFYLGLPQRDIDELLEVARLRTTAVPYYENAFQVLRQWKQKHGKAKKGDLHLLLTLKDMNKRDALHQLGRSTPVSLQLGTPEIGPVASTSGQSAGPLQLEFQPPLPPQLPQPLPPQHLGESPQLLQTLMPAVQHFEQEEREVLSHLERLTPDIINIGFIDTYFLECLQAENGIDDEAKKDIAAIHTPSQQHAALLDYIKADVRGRLSPFLRALERSNHTGVLRKIKLGLVLTAAGEVNWEHEKPVMLDTREAWTEIVAALHMHDVNFEENHSIFKNQRGFEDYSLNIAHQFTRLTLMRERKSFMEYSTEIDLKDVLGEGTRAVLFTGYPGSGKTCLILHIQTDWGKQMCGRQQHLYKALKGIKNSIYIRPNDCKDTLQETVEAILKKRCGKHALEATEHYNLHPEETSLLFDSIDEISGKEQLIGDICTEVEGQRRLILMGVRIGHPVFDEFRHAEFSHVKRIKVEGFKTSDIKEYMNKFFLACKTRNAESMKHRSVELFCQIIDQDERLQGLLSNPLLLCLTCVLMAEDRFKISDLKTITRLEIFRRVEQLFSKRQGCPVDLGTLRKFHKCCLAVLLEERRINADDLKNEGLDPAKLPFMSVVSTPLDITAFEVIAPHQAFVEYAAVEFLLNTEKKAQKTISAVIAGKRNMNHVLSFLADVFVEEKDKLLELINLALALQPSVGLETFNCRDEGTHKCCSSQNMLVRDQLGKIAVQDLLSRNFETHLLDDSADIQPCPTCWQDSEYAWSEEGRAIIQNIRHLIHMLPDEVQKADLLDSALRELYPGRIGETGLSLAVEGCNRKVEIKEPSQHTMLVLYEELHDVISTHAFTVWGCNRLETVALKNTPVEKLGTEASEVTRVWHEILDDIMTTTPMFTGEGLVSLEPCQDEEVLDIMRATDAVTSKIISKGIQMVEVVPQRWMDEYSQGTTWILCKDGWSMERESSQQDVTFNMSLRRMSSVPLSVPQTTRVVEVDRQTRRNRHTGDDGQELTVRATYVRDVTPALQAWLPEEGRKWSSINLEVEEATDGDVEAWQEALSGVRCEELNVTATSPALVEGFLQGEHQTLGRLHQERCTVAGLTQLPSSGALRALLEGRRWVYLRLAVASLHPQHLHLCPTQVMTFTYTGDGHIERLWLPITSIHEAEVIQSVIDTHRAIDSVDLHVEPGVEGPCREVDLLPLIQSFITQGEQIPLYIYHTPGGDVTTGIHDNTLEALPGLIQHLLPVCNDVTLYDCRVSGQALLHCVQHLSSTWRVEEGGWGADLNRPDTGVKVMQVEMWDPVIVYTTVEEKQQVEAAIHQTGICINPTWEHVA